MATHHLGRRLVGARHALGKRRTAVGAAGVVVRRAGAPDGGSGFVGLGEPGSGCVPRTERQRAEEQVLRFGASSRNCEERLEGVSRHAAPMTLTPAPHSAAGPFANELPTTEVGMKKLLLQLDPDRHPSAFDRIVAYDAGADEVLSYGGVTATDVTALVHGAIFTRGPGDLRHTAVWVGGTDVGRGRGAVRGRPDGLLRALSSERHDGRQRLQHDGGRRGGAPGRHRHAVRRAGGDPGRHRARRHPGGGAARARGGDRRAVLAIPRPGAGGVRAARRRASASTSRPARRGTRPA